MNHNLVMNALSLATGVAEVEHLVAAWEALVGHVAGETDEVGKTGTEAGEAWALRDGETP